MIINIRLSVRSQVNLPISVVRRMGRAERQWSETHHSLVHTEVDGFRGAPLCSTHPTTHR